MILRKDYVQLIQDAKAQVEVEKTKEHNKLMTLIFPSRGFYCIENMSLYFKYDDMPYSKYASGETPFPNLPIIHASDIILDNTLIKVESVEHGKKVIEWWKGHGVLTWMVGGNVGFYYGFINGKFGCYREEEIEGKKIITLPYTSQELIKQENKMRTISWEQGQEIIDMVEMSCLWKGKLLDLWANKIVLRKEISVSEELIQQGRKDASQAQNEIIDRIFGKEKGEIDLVNEKGLGDYKLFNKGMNKGGKFLISTPNAFPNSFWLNSDFNWELKGNYLTVTYKDT